MPHREHNPEVGFIPTTPQKLAGWRIDPPVSVPKAPKHRLADTAAADPPEEPPETRSCPDGDLGLIVFPKILVVVEDPIANSSKFVLPKKTDPLFNNLFVTKDS